MSVAVRSCRRVRQRTLRPPAGPVHACGWPERAMRSKPPSLALRRFSISNSTRDWRVVLYGLDEDEFDRVCDHLIVDARNGRQGHRNLSDANR